MSGVGVYGTLRVAPADKMPLFYACDFYGPFVNDSGHVPGLRNSGGNKCKTRFRRDLWTDGTSSVISNFAPTAVNFDGSHTVCLYAPEGSDGASGVWRLEEGSSFAYRVGNAHAISAGTLVTGEGVPDGAYVKRIYSDSIIELSQAAMSSTGEDGTTLDFAAFRPNAYQRIDKFESVYHNNPYRIGFWPMKHSEADEMTVEMFDLEASASNMQTHPYSFEVDCETGFLPGRLVFHNTSKFRNRLYVGTCDVEFAAPTNGTAAGFPNVVQMTDASADAKIRIPTGIEAAFGGLSNVVGRLVKTGAGTLTAPVLSNAYFGAADGGAVVVAEGELALSCDSGDPIQVQTLAITNGATFTIPACGFEAKAVFAESGAAVNGTGFFYVVETNDLSGISFGEGVTVVKLPSKTVAPETVYWETNVTAEVVGDPALWFDASKMESFEFSTAKTIAWGHCIRTWYDARGEGYGYARCYADAKPQYLLTNLLGQARFVRTGVSTSEASSNREALGFDKTVSGIRSVFKVTSAFSGGSVYLGGSATFRRNAGSTMVRDYTAPVFCNVSDVYTNSIAFYVNGDRRDWRKGYPFGANNAAYTSNPDLLVPMVTEVHFTDAATKPSAGGFGYYGKYDNGYDYIYECLIYTNDLTEVEKLSVRKYLMKKWCDASLNYVPDSMDTAASIDVGEMVAYRVDDRDAVVYSEMTGEGEFVKYGEGLVAVTKASSNSLHVAGGTLSLRSQLLPTISDLPGDPYLHLDASDADSLVVEDGKVASWADVRGAGHPVATALNAGKGPAYKTDALNGMPTIDFGSHQYRAISAYGADCPTLVYGAVPNAHTVIQVLDTSQGGGVLLGWHEQNQQSVASGMMYGLFRYNRHAYWDRPIVDTNSYASGYYDLQRLAQAGGARVSLNAKEVDGGTVGFTGGYDLVSVVVYKPMQASAIAQLGINATTFTCGGQKVCELLIYTNVLSRAEVKAVEAYLSKKWFNRVLPEYEQAGAKDVVVDAGATLQVCGGAPLRADSISGAGTVSGSVALVDGATISISVDEEGHLVTPDVTGGLSLAGGGTVVLSGLINKLASGVYPIAPVTSGAADEWAVLLDEPTRKRFSVEVEGGQLALVVQSPGMLLIVL